MDNYRILVSINISFDKTMVNKLLSGTKVCVSAWQNIVTVAGGYLEVDKASVSIVLWLKK